MSLYFTRHGQTDYNKAYLIQGSLDVSLNETGIKEAKELALKVKDMKFSSIYVSPYLRTRQTADEIVKILRIGYKTDERIKEENYGLLEGTSRKEEVYLEQRRKIATCYPNGESYLKVAARVYSFLDEVRLEAKENDILVVAHGGISRIVHSYFFDMSNEEFFAYGIPNCCLVKYDYK